MKKRTLKQLEELLDIFFREELKGQGLEKETEEMIEEWLAQYSCKDLVEAIAEKLRT